MRMLEYVISKQETLLAVMDLLERSAQKIVYVVEDDQTLLGAITDGDIRRFVLKHQRHDALAHEVMKAPCQFAQTKAEAFSKMQEHQIGSVPIVDEKMHVVDVVFAKTVVVNKELEKTLLDTMVVMMAGGKGERLYPYTAVLPKPLIPIQGVPIAQRIIERFAAVGLHQFILSLNYKKNIIKAYFDDVMHHLSFTYIEEQKPTGTGGSLRQMQDCLTQDFFVINCDNLIDLNIEELLRLHKEKQNIITVVTALKPMKIPYGVLQLGDDGEVLEVKEKPVMNAFINTGMYVVSPKLFSYFPEQEFFHMTDLLEICLDKKLKMGSYIIKEDAFLDMGQLDELDHMQQVLQAK